MQKNSMHDWHHVASQAFGANFRGTEQIVGSGAKEQGLSNGARRRGTSWMRFECRPRSWRSNSMNPVQKALWYIESHLAQPLTLDEIAGVAGISRFHMVRAFGAATGFSVMRYARARRLSEAARALANGAPD